MNEPVVTIVQEYVPDYRAPLFDAMRSRARDASVRLRVVAGSPQGTRAARGDAAQFVPDSLLEQREWKIFGLRLTVRQAGREYRQSDLVIVEQARRNLDVLVALTLRFRKTALWGHGADASQEVGSARASLLRWITRRACWVFAYTDAGAQAAISAGVSPETVTVLHNSTDTRSLRRHLASITDDERREFATEHGLAGRTVAYVGALDRSKRLDLLVESCRAQASEDSTFRLLVVGAGPDAAMIPNEPWAVRLGALRGRALARVFDACQLLVIPGAIGLVATDALAAATPVVTTNDPWHGPERAYLDESVCLTTAADGASLADGMRQLLDDHERRHAMSDAAREISAGYSIEAMADRFIEGIQRALAKA